MHHMARQLKSGTDIGGQEESAYLKTGLMDIVPTSGFAVHNLFGIR
jgi:hypothetical protein